MRATYRSSSKYGCHFIVPFKFVLCNTSFGPKAFLLMGGMTIHQRTQALSGGKQDMLTIQKNVGDAL